jgi:hypothetical protein
MCGVVIGGEGDGPVVGWSLLGGEGAWLGEVVVVVGGIEVAVITGVVVIVGVG